MIFQHYYQNSPPSTRNNYYVVCLAAHCIIYKELKTIRPSIFGKLSFQGAFLNSQIVFMISLVDEEIELDT